MLREFCTAGPIRPEQHYHIPPLARVGLETRSFTIGGPFCPTHPTSGATASSGRLISFAAISR